MKQIDWFNILGWIAMMTYCLFVAGCALNMTNAILTHNGTVLLDWSWFSIFSSYFPVFIICYVVCGFITAFFVCILLTFVGV